MLGVVPIAALASVGVAVEPDDAVAGTISRSSACRAYNYSSSSVIVAGAESE